MVNDKDWLYLNILLYQSDFDRLCCYNYSKISMAYHLKVLFLIHAICQLLVSYSFASDIFSLWGQGWFQSLSRTCWFHVRGSCEPGNYFMASAQTCTQNCAHSHSFGWSKTCDQSIINATKRYISSMEATQAHANGQRWIVFLYIQRKRRINLGEKMQMQFAAVSLFFLSLLASPHCLMIRPRRWWIFFYRNGEYFSIDRMFVSMFQGEKVFIHWANG